MLLYNYNFSLLAPPPRSPLSWGSEQTRAMIPNFETVKQLSEFVSRLFDQQFQVDNFTVQFQVGIGFESLILFMSSLIIGRRIYEGNFWIFRLIKTSTGPIIVPNTMLAFICTETVFKASFIALLAEFIRFHNPQSNGPPNMLLWILLPWCSLIFGAFLATIGTYYATPKGVRHGIKNKDQHSNPIKRFFLHAWTANVMALSIPILCCISIAIPSFIANAHYMQARSEQLSWLTRYDQATYFTQEMVVEVQLIWYKALRAMRLTAIIYLLWFVWAMVCFVLYTFLSIRLVKAILTEMKKARMEEMKFLVTTLRVPIQDEFSEIDDAQNMPMNDFQIQAGHGLEEGERITKQNNPNILMVIKEEQNDQTQFRKDGAPFNVRIAHKTPSNELLLQQNLKNKTSEKTLQEQNVSNDKKREESPKKSKSIKRLSNLLMNQKRLDKKAKTIKLTSINEQKRELKIAAFNILAQVMVISPGCIIFGGIALFLGLTVYGGYEQPLFMGNSNGIGTYFERFFGVAIIFVLYAVIVLGAFIFFCILLRVYEPVFVKNYQNQDTSSSSFNSNPIQNISKNSSRL